MYAHIGIAFVSTNHKSSRFGNGKIDTRQGNFTSQKRISKVQTSRFCEILRVSCSFFSAKMFMKSLANV